MKKTTDTVVNEQFIVSKILENGPPRIIIVEDELTIAIDLKRIITSFNYEVVGIFTSAEEAIYNTGSLRPDLVLMDIYLQGDMDGIAAARTIVSTYRIPTIFITAVTDKDILDGIWSAEPYGLLEKPVAPRDLFNAINFTLYRSRVDKKLMEKTEQYSQVMKNIEKGVWIINQDEATTFVNDKMAHMLGYEVDEMLGKSVYFFSDINWKTVYSTTPGELDKDISKEAEFEFITKKGKRENFTVSVFPIIDRTGTYKGACAIVDSPG